MKNRVQISPGTLKKVDCFNGNFYGLVQQTQAFVLANSFPGFDLQGQRMSFLAIKQELLFPAVSTAVEASVKILDEIQYEFEKVLYIERILQETLLPSLREFLDLLIEKSNICIDVWTASLVQIRWMCFMAEPARFFYLPFPTVEVTMQRPVFLKPKQAYGSWSKGASSNQDYCGVIAS